MGYQNVETPRSSLTSTFARVFGVPAPTGVAATDTARIAAQAAAALAAGGGTVQLQAGQYEINAALPILPGVTYEGAPAVAGQVTKTTGSWLADGRWQYDAGTVLHGDGTTDCFAVNTTDQATVPASIGTTEVPGARIRNLAIDNFVTGVHAGASNQIGMTWGALDNLYISNCSSWGVNLVNFAHMSIGKIQSQMCQNGQRYASELDIQVFQPANSILSDLYNLTPNDDRDRRKCRGVVFESLTPADGNDASLGQLLVQRAQCNRYSVTKLTETVTFTSGSANIDVPDGTLFLPGMIVQFAATVAGFTQNYSYVVKTVTGNVITLATSKRGSAQSASASTTGSLVTYGFAAIEVAGAASGSLIQGSQFLGLDAEGSASTGVYLEGLRTTDVRTTTLPLAANMLNAVGIVARDVSSTCTIYNATTCDTDFDSSSGNVVYMGARSVSWGRSGRGLFYDDRSPSGALAIAAGSNERQGGDIQIRANGVMYPASGMGEKVYQRDTSISLIGTNCGHVISTASSGITYTLPEITSDASGSVATSAVGVWYEVTVLGAGTVTVNTSNSQTINKISGRTSHNVTTGQAVRFIAARDNGGTLFWLARVLTPVT